jgi:hypothetical protein
MKSAVLFTVLFLVQSVFAGQGSFPAGPDRQLTPGETCTHPTEYRYPEHIPYCERNVDSELKRDIIRMYDRERGFTIQQMPRGQFKIDHYIPLCMGGSNERENLWPQHQSVYNITDPMEPALCQKMAEGKVTQARAMELIRQGKNNLDQVPAVMREINSL